MGCMCMYGCIAPGRSLGLTDRRIAKEQIRKHVTTPPIIITTPGDERTKYFVIQDRTGAESSVQRPESLGNGRFQILCVCLCVFCDQERGCGLLSLLLNWVLVGVLLFYEG